MKGRNMGYTNKTYVGAYVLIKAAPVTVQRVETGCRTHGAQPKGANFCPECGQPITEIVRNEVRSARLYDLLPEQEFEDVLHSPWDVDGLADDELIALGNESAAGQVEDGDIMEITPEIIAQCLAEFQNHYAHVLTVLAGRALSFEIKFGLVHYVI